MSLNPSRSLRWGVLLVACFGLTRLWIAEMSWRTSGTGYFSCFFTVWNRAAVLFYFRSHRVRFLYIGNATLQSGAVFIFE